ncbi:sialin-like protein 5, partial [Sarcoptes scabiei]
MFAENSDKKPLEPIERDERFRLRSFSTIPMRYVFVGLSFIVYSFKAVLSMAIVAMVNDKDDHHSISARNLDDSKFNWNDAIKNNLLGSFFYGYVLTQIPAGIFGNKYGGKWIFSVCLLIASICSLLSPIAARQSYLFLMGLRFVQGLVEGVVFPCMNTLIAQWMPIMERTRGSTIIFSGSLIGSVFTLQTTSYFNDSQWGWPASFYLLGTIGVIWFVLFATLVYECPESHPYISLEERNYIVENGGGKRADMDVKIPYRKILTSIPVYGLLLTNFLQNWLMLTLFLYMPTYFKDILRMSHKQITWISGLPHLGCAMFGWLCSYLTD